MEKVVLHATRRSVTGKQVGVLRREGKLPAVLYGHGFETTAILLDLRESTRALVHLTGSSLITIELDGKEHAALVREKQRDYIRNVLLHVDFQVVSMTEKIRAMVPVVITGVAPAVKDFNGVVVTGLDEIEVEALPQDLPEQFIIDIANLANIGDGIYVRDVVISDKVHIHEGKDEMIVVITAEMGEEPVEVATEGPAEPEVIERGKKEEAEE
jgi:large subunit ribosomal protein L25